MKRTPFLFKSPLPYCITTLRLSRLMTFAVNWAYVKGNQKEE
jgi:hypothetical protein